MAEEDQEQLDFDRALENFDEEEHQEGGSDEDSQQAAIWEYEEQYGRVGNDAQSGKKIRLGRQALQNSITDLRTFVLFLN